MTDRPIHLILEDLEDVNAQLTRALADIGNLRPYQEWMDAYYRDNLGGTEEDWTIADFEGEIEDLRERLVLTENDLRAEMNGTADLSNALADLLEIIDMAGGAQKLCRGVDLGQMSWMVKFQGAIDYARPLADRRVRPASVMKEPHWACSGCGHSGEGFSTVKDHEGDADVQCPNCGSVEVEESPEAALQRMADRIAGSLL